MRLSLLITGIFLLPLFSASANSCAQALARTPEQEEISVRMSRPDGYPLFEVSAAMTVDASVPRSWAVLTDYGRLAEFVPNLSASQLLSHEGNEGVVSQTGYAKFLFIRQTIELMLHVAEQPMHTIDIALISGNMRQYRARWEVQMRDSGHTQITYTGSMAPDFYVPPLFGTVLMKSDLHNMLRAVKTEMEKRP